MAAHSGDIRGRRLFAPLLILLILIILGFWLRVHNLDAFSFWTDEGLTPERSGYPVPVILRNIILIQNVVTTDTHPPLYYLIIHATRPLLGLSDFAFRYPSVLFGVLLIPLIYQLGRRLGGPAVGLLVALLAAANPLQVYYSQEARMYTLLVLLVTGMSYILWRDMRLEIRDTSSEARPSELVSRISNLVSPFVYALLSALAVYTHYTAVFIVAAQAPFWVWVLWRKGMKRVILGAAAAAVLVAVPLIPYTVPRLLTGAEANYRFVAPLTMLLDVVRFFNLGLTVDFGRPLIIALNTLAFGLALLGLWASMRYEIRDTRLEIRDTRLEIRDTSGGARGWVRPVFLLAWLLAPVLGLMLGSLLFKPMYQGVRHIMAGSPAFLLLLAFGLNEIRNTRYEIRVQKRAPLNSYLVSLISNLVLALVVGGFSLALFNLYTNPAFVKDDFRAIVRFIETRAGGRDAVVYNNAVLLPLHEHYRQRHDLPVTAIPAYPQIATGHEPELLDLATTYDRVWFITDPPADGRDDDALIRGWLDANQTAVVNRLFPARTTEARVIGYLIDNDAPTATVSAAWPRLPQLTGARLHSPVMGPALWVDLVWRGERPVVNASLLFTLTGPDGAEYHREARALLPDRDTRWDDAAAVRLSYHLPLPPGLPPGRYAVALSAEGHGPLALGDVAIAPTSDWPAAPEALFDEVPRPPSPVAFPGGLSLAGVIPWDDAVLPGNNLPLTLYWRVGPGGADLSGLRYRLEVIDGRGRALRVQEDRPGAPWLGPVDGGALLREDTAVYMRPDVEPGTYRLRWTLLDGDTPLGRPQTHGRITVEPWPLRTAAPPAPYTSGAEFGDAIRLHSYNMGLPTGGRLPLTFHWQTMAPPDDYVVFVHLVNEAGEIVSQVDSIPVGGARPTSGWRPREVISDDHHLPIPDDLPPGHYHVNVGLYNPDDGARPAVTLDGAPQPGNQLRLTTLELPWSTP